VRSLLALLLDVHLVRRVDESDGATAGEASPPRYELTHDVLADLVLILTRDLQDKRRQAARALTRAMEDVKIKRFHTVGLRELYLLFKHASTDAMAQPKAAALMKRSLVRGVVKSVLLYVLVPLLALFFVQKTFSHITIEHDLNHRVVVQRGLP